MSELTYFATYLVQNARLLGIEAIIDPSQIDVSVCLTIVHVVPEKEELAKQRIAGQATKNLFNVFQFLKDDHPRVPFILHFNDLYFRILLNPYSRVKDVIRWLGLDWNPSLMEQLDGFNAKFLESRAGEADHDAKLLGVDNLLLPREDPLHEALWVSSYHSTRWSTSDLCLYENEYSYFHEKIETFYEIMVDLECCLHQYDSIEKPEEKAEYDNWIQSDFMSEKMNLIFDITLAEDLFHPNFLILLAKGYKGFEEDTIEYIVDWLKDHICYVEERLV